MENSDAPKSQDNTTEAKNNSQNSGTLGSVSLKSENPPTPHKSCCSYHHAKATPWWKRLSTWQFVAEIAIFMVGVRVACIYKGQLEQMIMTNRISHDALVASQRPWLMNDGTATYTFRISGKDMATTTFTFNVKNFGPSPALDVGFGIYPFIRGDPNGGPERHDLFEDARKQACQSADGIITVSGNSIFPQQVHTYGTGGMIEGSMVSKVGAVLFYGCIAYRDQFDTKHTTHYTTFCVFGPVKEPHPPQLALCGRNELAD